MVVNRIAVNALRICGLIALILGIIFWTSHGLGLVPIHMLLGVIVVLALWYLAYAQMAAPGSMPRPSIVGAVIGVLVVVVGLWQMSFGRGLVQVLHVLLGLLAIAMGERLFRLIRGGGRRFRAGKA